MDKTKVLCIILHGLADHDVYCDGYKLIRSMISYIYYQCTLVFILTQKSLVHVVLVAK